MNGLSAGERAKECSGVDGRAARHMLWSWVTAAAELLLCTALHYILLQFYIISASQLFHAPGSNEMMTTTAEKKYASMA